MGKFNKIKIFLIIALLLVLPFASTIVNAITFEDLVEQGKRLLGTEKNPKSLASNSIIEITSDILLTENGDLNGNGEMDGGDTIRFSFVISNGTDKPHPFSKLKTSIKRDAIHFIHNVKGVTGIDNSTLELPNIYVFPNSKLEISFDAQLNFSGGEQSIAAGDEEISSQPLLEDNKKQKIAEGIKKIKKFKQAALKNGSITILKNNKKESTSSATEVTEPAIASPSALEEAGEASASQSAQEGGN